MDSASLSQPPATISSLYTEAERQKKTRIYDKYKEKISILPKEKGWVTNHMYKYQGFWFESQWIICIEGVMAVQDNFQAHPTDILLASSPKSGTTWLKALGFTIVNRAKYKNLSHHPLLTTNPHPLVPLIEVSIYKKTVENDFNETSNSPRLLATHIPYSSLPETFFTSGCRIVYICRNPKDEFISRWIFFNKLRGPSRPPITLEDAFDMFTSGVSPFGPSWDHVLGYYKASLKHPNKVLFLKYEDLKKYPSEYVKRMAEFLGYPFSKEEEANGAVEEIVKLCSFEKLRNLEINKNEFTGTFFRKGIVGDSVNYLSPEMIQIMDQITQEKFLGTDIMF